jgi:hypothetical protein
MASRSAVMISGERSANCADGEHLATLRAVD